LRNGALRTEIGIKSWRKSDDVLTKVLYSVVVPDEMSAFDGLVQKLLQQALSTFIEVFDTMVTVQEFVCVVDRIQKVGYGLIPLRLRYERLHDCSFQHGRYILGNRTFKIDVTILAAIFA
jgi:hypothetical protein